MTSTPVDVLIVDDEPQVCRLIRDALSQAGLRCTVVSDPQEARALLRARRFAVLITDIAMPHLDGLELLHFARRYRPACRVILITGRSSHELLTQAVAAGAYDYLQKPFRISQLCQAVENAAFHGGAPPLPSRAAEAMEARQAALDSVRALVGAVEAKDPYTRQHSEQVAHYAVHIARCLDLDDRQIESIRVASLLHDVGKIGVPDEILRKPGRLTEAEFAHIRRHPVVGEEILVHINLFRTEARLVRHHHERWDGQGYPDGLAGAAIPLGARIIQTADCIDAMLMTRTYKNAYPPARMLTELQRCAGTQFDPRLAETAHAWCASNGHQLVLPHARPELHDQTRVA